MHKLILPALLAALMASSLGAAAKASIVVRGSTDPLVAYVIESEALVGVAWRSDRTTAGRTVPIWEVVHVRYDGNVFDQYNSMAGRLSAQQARRLLEDAQSYIKDAEGGKVPSMMNEAEWSRVVLACRYYAGYALMMQNKNQEAVDKFIEYLKAADEKPADVGLPAPYKSPHSNKEIARAGGLHRLYLDALENLGKCYMALGDVQNATEKAFKPLKALGEVLAQRQQNVEFYDWPLRGLRTMAASAEAAKNYKEARTAYEALEKIARTSESPCQTMS
jgi:tetratricopeptide (TPR) repeat protein